MKPKILIATSSFGELEPSLIQNLNKEFELCYCAVYEDNENGAEVY